MKKILFIFTLLTLLCLLFAFSVSAEQAYLEEIPSEWLYSSDTVTHFIVFEGNEYFNDSTTINAFQTAVMDEALTKVKVSKDSSETVSVSTADIGVKYLTKFIFPSTTTQQSPVTCVNINAFKSNRTYFWDKVGAIILPSSMTQTSDMNEAVDHLRYIDFGEGSQLTSIPGWFCNGAAKLTCVKNFPESLTSIGRDAFNNCKNAFHGVLYINATTVYTGAFNNAITHLTGLVFGPNVQSIENQTFCARHNETGLGNPQIKFIEFQCSVSGLSLQAAANDKGSFNFAPKSGNPRSSYSSLKCVVISHESDLALIEEGKTTIQELNANIYFDEQGGNLVSVSHKEGAMSSEPIYSSYYETGYLKYTCPDCGKETLTPQAPFFACLGYSRTDGSGLAPSITVGFKVDMKILNKYEELTGHTVTFGAIVVGSDKLDYAPLDENGEINELVDATVFKIPIESGHSYFDCKIVGFTDSHLDTKLMLGAYIIEAENDTVISIAYMQRAQVENGNFEFISYNTVK